MERMNSKSDNLISADMLIALLIPAVIAVYYYGIRAVMIIVVSVAVCLLTDMICYKLRGRVRVKAEISTVVTGLTIALMMSAAVPFYAVVTADLFAMIICKHAFGGRGNEIFNCVIFVQFDMFSNRDAELSASCCASEPFIGRNAEHIIISVDVKKCSAV